MPKRNLDIGDIVCAKENIWRGMEINNRPPCGPIIWIQPGSGRICVRGCGKLFLPHDLEYKYMFIKDIDGFYGQRRK